MTDTKRRVRLALTCPEIAELSVPTGQLVNPGYDVWVTVTGGALALAWWDATNPINEENFNHLHGAPKELRWQASSAIDLAIAQAYQGPEVLNVFVADLYMHESCEVMKQFYNRRRSGLPIPEQATATFRELLRLNQDRRRYHKRPKLSLAGLTTTTYNLGEV